MSRLRRDPRAERAAHGVEGGTRPRFDLAAAPAAKRTRRDPRAEQRQVTAPGTARLRLDRTQRVPALAIAPERPVVETAPQVRIIAEPAFLVAAVPDAPGGRLTPHDRQLLGAARVLADAGGGAVLAIVPGVVEGLGAAGADRVLVLAETKDFDPEGRADAIGGTLASLKVRHALFAETADGGDLARRIAAQLGEPLFTGAESLTAKVVTRAARGRRVEQRLAPPRLLTIAADAVAPHGGTIHEARTIDAPFPSAEAKRGILAAAFIPADPATVPLAEAAFVVSAGNGVSDFDVFLALAVALGATPGASRVVCDAGLMPRAAQVGASGTVLEAACYFALGIAGAPQHLQGVAKCEHVVAVNTDLHAAMIERAGLAVVADAQLVMPAIIAALQAEEGA
ncbi:electron transfer flavoprotein subunit alpha/FixB family protein [Starkeya sp. ORNL1]|uniref:electron transfer flavoprotein subunit alpha/FixB family protein n=1 Tax=Starkeya sp. ORNL1 TaxID=2709380 RepID=UPI00146490F5|nr:electron transfer flavoprotein subunit alpha/FixB family protein [Starkeya sp. ORNL1]QJP16492.1 electron transfer flavoprotein subunit alpha/FixB family protein [Starkeya sp. ORNL1]